MTEAEGPASEDVVENLHYHSRKMERVNIRKLKEFAFSRLPMGNPLREIILSQQDLLDPNEFLAKIDVLLRLSRLVSAQVPEIRNRSDCGDEMK